MRHLMVSLSFLFVAFQAQAAVGDTLHEFQARCLETVSNGLSPVVSDLDIAPPPPNGPIDAWVIGDGAWELWSVPDTPLNCSFVAANAAAGADIDDVEGWVLQLIDSGAYEIVRQNSGGVTLRPLTTTAVGHEISYGIGENLALRVRERAEVE
ncbi:hypothetical protein QTA57_03820 [Fontisubflavum oceani]|uniref:hypothetical protein n=1 Tax=Fontisubflavum oceani TaxID=2978973 RepID=UPI0025B580D9|nr:hypothetical protein [Fontisubflavum oceani]WJY22288.1 hypothetical protein QTA57_03820 [Fontisubflavum oceani]